MQGLLEESHSGSRLNEFVAFAKNEMYGSMLFDVAELNRKIEKIYLLLKHNEADPILDAELLIAAYAEYVKLAEIFRLRYNSREILNGHFLEFNTNLQIFCSIVDRVSNLLQNEMENISTLDYLPSLKDVVDAVVLNCLKEERDILLRNIAFGFCTAVILLGILGGATGGVLGILYTCAVISEMFVLPAKILGMIGVCSLVMGLYGAEPIRSIRDKDRKILVDEFKPALDATRKIYSKFFQEEPSTESSRNATEETALLDIRNERSGGTFGKS